MDSFEINKMVAAVLVAGLIGMVAGQLSRALVHEEVPEDPAYMVAGMQAEPAGGEAEQQDTGPEPVAPLLAAATVEDGQSVARKCQACHSFDQGGPNKIGPNLYNIVGGPKAHAEGFNYSSALSGAEGTWSYEDLNGYLHDPRGWLPGTRMSFPGLKKAEERAAMIKYLMSITENPPPVPES